MTFTGPDLYRAFNAPDEDTVPWGSVSRDIQDLHVCAAAIVHQTRIAPLQQLVIALQHQLHTRPFVSVWGEEHAVVAAWEERNAALDAQAEKLLREEVKE